MDTKVPLATHPYYPHELELVGFKANDMNVVQMLSIFAAGWVVILSITNYVVQKINPKISSSELATAMWFVLSGSIHLFFEGYFSYHFNDLPQIQTFFAQLWKEYARSDSRYLSQDAFVFCMETITAFLWGPLAFIVAGLITANHPLRHPIQIIVSLGQLYGDVLYYATNTFESYVNQVSYSRPESLYFWGYYIFMNFFWIIIPLILVYRSATETSKAFVAINKATISLKKSQYIHSMEPNGDVQKSK